MKNRTQERRRARRFFVGVRLGDCGGGDHFYAPSSPERDADVHDGEDEASGGVEAFLNTPSVSGENPKEIRETVSPKREHWLFVWSSVGVANHWDAGGKACDCSSDRCP